MNKQNKHDTRPCPSCGSPKFRKNFGKMVFHCDKCRVLICDRCAVFNHCMKCHLEETVENQILEYNTDKYGGLAL